MKKSRRTYTWQPKLGALRLLETSDKSVAHIKRDFGIRGGCLSRWQPELAVDGEGAFPGQGHLTPDQEYTRQAERENEMLRQERNILHLL